MGTGPRSPGNPPPRRRLWRPGPRGCGGTAQGGGAVGTPPERRRERRTGGRRTCWLAWASDRRPAGRTRAASSPSRASRRTSSWRSPPAAPVGLWASGCPWRPQGRAIPAPLRPPGRGWGHFTPKTGLNGRPERIWARAADAAPRPLWSQLWEPLISVTDRPSRQVTVAHPRGPSAAHPVNPSASPASTTSDAGRNGAIAGLGRMRSHSLQCPSMSGLPSWPHRTNHALAIPSSAPCSRPRARPDRGRYGVFRRGHGG